MKEQLESVVLQMYKAGVPCSEAVREFQKVFILLLLSDEDSEPPAIEKPKRHRHS